MPPKDKGCQIKAKHSEISEAKINITLNMYNGYIQSIFQDSFKKIIAPIKIYCGILRAKEEQGQKTCCEALINHMSAIQF